MAQQYDIVLTDSGGDNNFMLKQEGQIKRWRVEDAPLLPQTLITESASPSHIQPEREIQISQVDWRKGIQDFLLEDSRKYYDSENCDARMKGQVILSPEKATSFGALPVEVTLSNLTNPDFESWTDTSTLDDWTVTGDDLTRSTDELTGSYAASLYNSITTAIKSTVLSQTMSWDDSYQGREVSFTAYAKTAYGRESIYLEVDDGVDTTVSDTITSTTYSRMEAHHEIAATATQLVLRIYLATTANTYDRATVDTAALALSDGLKDPTFRLWTNSSTLEHWTRTGGTGTVVQGSITYRPSLYGYTETAEIYQDMPTFSAASVMWAALTYSSSPYVGGTQRVGVDYGGDTYWFTLPESTSSTTVYFSAYLPAASTRCRIRIQSYGSGSSKYLYPTRLETWTLTPGACTKMVEFGSYVYVAIGNVLARLNLGILPMKEFDNEITDLCVYQDRLYIAQGWSNAYYYTSDLTTFTESTLLGGDTGNVSATTQDYTASETSIVVVKGTAYGSTPFYARWEDEVVNVTNITSNTLTVARAQLGSTAAAHDSGTDIRELGDVAGAKYMANVGDSQFWISDTNNTMRDSDDPINNGTPFSSQYTVGSDAWDITGLVNHDEIVFCRKEDDVYYLSEADVLSLLNLKTEASTTYPHGLYIWGDKLYIPSGVNSFYEYDIASGVATTISPARYAPNDTNYDGTITAVTHDESYLYIAVDNGSDVKILAGRWENVAGSTDWYWHPLYDFASNDIKAMLISSASGDKRLYAGTDTYTDGIYPFVVPISYSGIYLESGYTAEATGEFITPWFATNFPTEEKYWKSIDITSICITDKTSITPYYQIKGGTWTAMTALTASALDGTDYPVETTDNREIDATSERIRFKFVFATSDKNYTPILYGSGGGFVVYANLLPDRSRQIVATIDLAPQIRLRDNSIVERQVDDDLTTLRGLYTANEAITVTGPDGTTYSTIFARDGYTEQLAYEDETIRLEHWWIELKLLEV